MARIARWGGVAALAIALMMPTSAAAQVFEPGELSELPKIKSPNQAQSAIIRTYPKALQDNGVGGKVQLRFVVKADGTVDAESVEIVAASVKALGSAAKRAIAAIKFVPGKKDGSAVDSKVVMPITYGG